MPKYNYPVPRRSDVVETIHGREIKDPYRWMEDPDNAETKEYVKQQQSLTDPFLDALGNSIIQIIIIEITI